MKTSAWIGLIAPLAIACQDMYGGTGASEDGGEERPVLPVASRERSPEPSRFGAPVIEPDGGLAVPPPPPPLPPLDCGATDSGCGVPRDMGTIRGDAASRGNELSAGGMGTEWFVFRLEEKRLKKASLNATITLAAEGDTDYDLYVYYADEPSILSCTDPRLSGRTVGVDSESLALRIEDRFFGSFWNFDLSLSNESRAVVVEVRYAGGECSPFELAVRGPV